MRIRMKLSLNTMPRLVFVLKKFARQLIPDSWDSTDFEWFIQNLSLLAIHQNKPEPRMFDLYCWRMLEAIQNPSVKSPNTAPTIEGVRRQWRKMRAARFIPGFKFLSTILLRANLQFESITDFIRTFSRDTYV
jgi:hypothetical protein